MSDELEVFAKKGDSVMPLRNNHNYCPVLVSTSEPRGGYLMSGFDIAIIAVCSFAVGASLATIILVGVLS